MKRDMFKGVCWLSVYIVMLMIFYVFFVRTSVIDGVEISVFGGLIFESITKFLELFTVYYLSKMIAKTISKQPTSYIKYIFISIIIMILCINIMSGIDTIMLVVAKIIEGSIFNTNVLSEYKLMNWFLFELLPFKQPIFDIAMIKDMSIGYYVLGFIAKVFLYYLPVSLSFLMPLYTLRFIVKKPISQHIVNVLDDSEGIGYEVYYRLTNFKRRKALIKVIQLSFIFIIITFMVWNKNFIIYPFLIVILKLYFATIFWSDSNKRVYEFYDYDTKELVSSPNKKESIFITLDDDKNNKSIDVDQEDEKLVERGLLVEKCVYNEYVWKKENGFIEALKELGYFIGLCILCVVWVFINEMLPIHISLYTRDVIDFVLVVSSLFIVGNMIFKRSVRYNAYTFLLISLPIIVRILIQIIIYIV